MGKELENTQSEERLLHLDSIDVTDNSRNIIINMQSKKSLDSHDENSPGTDDKETVLD